MDSFGEIGMIRWFCDYADLAIMEEVGNQLNTHQEYRQKVIEASDFIMQGSVCDTVMRAI